MVIGIRARAALTSPPVLMRRRAIAIATFSLPWKYLFAVWEDMDIVTLGFQSMSSETANKYFQGKENIAIAIARRRIKTGGDVKAALSLIPITKPIYARYREYLEREHPHLLA